jgi:hypothetical protein
MWQCLQEEQALFEMGDMLSDMLKANQALASAASSMMDAAHIFLDVHTDNGAVCFPPIQPPPPSRLGPVLPVRLGVLFEKTHLQSE